QDLLYLIFFCRRQGLDVIVCLGRKNVLEGHRGNLHSGASLRRVPSCGRGVERWISGGLTVIRSGVAQYVASMFWAAEVLLELELERHHTIHCCALDGCGLNQPCSEPCGKCFGRRSPVAGTL